MDDRRNRPSWLSALLAPTTVDEFLSKFWLKTWFLGREPGDRFSTFLAWADLNNILESHWREPFRFRLALRGRDLDPASYVDHEARPSRVRSRDVTDHLRRGATLSFDAIDELHEPLKCLARRFETFFRAATQVNVYAGWRNVHGLDLHRDDEEIFVFQLDGRKRWLLYGPSLDGIDCSQLAGSSSPPPGASLDQILEPGDMLYIPRGCYHVAIPMNAPTLHLTVGVRNPRGIDLLRWMVERLKTVDISERGLPVLADSAERVRCSEQLRGALVAGLTDDLVEQYLVETGSNITPRPSFSLPWSATSTLLPGGRDFLIQMNGRVRSARNGSSAGSFELRFSNRTFRFPPDMQWIVEQLDDGSSRSFAAVVDAVGGRIDEAMVRMLLGMLVKENLVAVTA